MSACLFPGSFDPPTNGHLDLIRRLSALFDRVYVCQMENIAKKALLPPERRTALLREACRGLANVEVIQGAGFTVHMARSCGAKVIARGVRGSQDFAYETQIAKANAYLDPELETLLLLAKPEHEGLSSSVVREIYGIGGDASGLVPDCVWRELLALRARGRS